MIPSKHIILKVGGEYITRVVAKELEEVYVSRSGVEGYTMYYKSGKKRKGLELFVGIKNIRGDV